MITICTFVWFEAEEEYQSRFFLANVPIFLMFQFELKSDSGLFFGILRGFERQVLQISKFSCF